MSKTHIDGSVLKVMFGAGVQRVSDNVSLINELNVFPVPDGDTGINLYHTLQRAWQEIATSDEDAVNVIAERFAYGALMGARGNSGTILSQLLTGFADRLAHEKFLTAPLLMDACSSAVARAYAAVSQPVEGTILTVAREAAERLPSATSLDEMLATMVNAAQVSLDNTPNLLPMLEDAGVVDAGGMGLLCFLQGIQLNHCSASHDIGVPALSDTRRPRQRPSPGESYGYDVQFLMLGQSLDVNKVRRQMERLGWSVIVVGDAAAIKGTCPCRKPRPATGLRHSIRRRSHRRCSREYAAAGDGLRKSHRASGDRNCGAGSVGHCSGNRRRYARYLS